MQYISITKHEHGDVFLHKTPEDSTIQTEHKINLNKLFPTLNVTRKTIHTRNQFQSVSANPVAVQWCSLWAQLASNQRLDKVKPAWRSPSHHSCRFHSFSPNARHKWMCLCGCLCIISCWTECNPQSCIFFFINTSQKPTKRSNY